MRHKRTKRLAVCAVFLALFTVGLIPASAHEITSASVSGTCSSYTISVAGDNATFVGVNYSVNYIITLTPSSGSAFTISDSIQVSPDASGNFSASVTKPVGPLSGGYSVSGSATLVDGSGDTFNPIAISFANPTFTCPSQTPPGCPAQTSNSSNFNGTPISGGDYIWFNANFTASGVPSTGATLTLTNSTIHFTADQTYNLAVPNAQITFSPSATCTSTTFDTITNTWMTTVPVSGDDEIFLSGLAWLVPASFANAGGRVNSQVVWNGTLSSSASGISINWKWGAAVYTNFTTNYNALNVKAGHQHACGLNNGDHAATPEGTDSTGQPWGKFVTGGARGGGGSNFTGSWSETISVRPVCPAS